MQSPQLWRLVVVKTVVNFESLQFINIYYYDVVNLLIWLKLSSQLKYQLIDIQCM